MTDDTALPKRYCRIDARVDGAPGLCPELFVLSIYLGTQEGCWVEVVLLLAPWVQQADADSVKAPGASRVKSPSPRTCKRAHTLARLGRQLRFSGSLADVG